MTWKYISTSHIQGIRVEVIDRSSLAHMHTRTQVYLRSSASALLSWSSLPLEHPSSFGIEIGIEIIRLGLGHTDTTSISQTRNFDNPDSPFPSSLNFDIRTCTCAHFTILIRQFPAGIQPTSPYVPIHNTNTAPLSSSRHLPSSFSFSVSFSISFSISFSFSFAFLFFSGSVESVSQSVRYQSNWIWCGGAVVG